MADTRYWSLSSVAGTGALCAIHLDTSLNEENALHINRNYRFRNYCLYLFKPKNKPAIQDYFISTQGQSEERVKKLDFNKASENASYILDTNRLSFLKSIKQTGDAEYKPDTEKDWIINIKSLKPTLFTTEQLFKIFDKDWRVNYSAADIYGYSDQRKNGLMQLLVANLMFIAKFK